MRTAIFMGLIAIAKSLKSEQVYNDSTLLATLTFIFLIVDGMEFYKKQTKN